MTSVVGVGMLDAAADGEPVSPPALQTKGVGPGMLHVVSVRVTDGISTGKCDC